MEPHCKHSQSARGTLLGLPLNRRRLNCFYEQLLEGHPHEDRKYPYFGYKLQCVAYCSVYKLFYDEFKIKEVNLSLFADLVASVPVISEI